MELLQSLQPTPLQSDKSSPIFHCNILTKLTFLCKVAIINQIPWIVSVVSILRQKIPTLHDWLMLYSITDDDHVHNVALWYGLSKNVKKVNRKRNHYHQHTDNYHNHLNYPDKNVQGAAGSRRGSRVPTYHQRTGRRYYWHPSVLLPPGSL